MELTSEQKHDIGLELNASDIYETVPFLNKVLAAIGYVDRLDDDSEREELRWTKRKEPLIKDKKIRKAVRAWVRTWAEFSYEESLRAVVNDDFISLFCDVEHYSASPEMDISPESFGGGVISDHYYTIAELCGEEEE